jgi:hypothetical protein
MHDGLHCMGTESAANIWQWKMVTNIETVTT